MQTLLGSHYCVFDERCYHWDPHGDTLERGKAALGALCQTATSSDRTLDQMSFFDSCASTSYRSCTEVSADGMVRMNRNLLPAVKRS